MHPRPAAANTFVRPLNLLAALMLSATFTGWVVAAVTPVGPFSGQFHDTFDQFTATNAVAALDVFGGRGVIRKITDGSIKVEWSSQLGGDLVTPLSGMMIGQLCVADWEFAQPASRFGGYWENNSHADDATLVFYDASNNELATLIATVPDQAQQWTWNGWESDVPFSRIRVTGNGLINGFIWYENMELTLAPIPEPAAIVILSVVSVGLFRRRPLSLR